MVRKWKWSLLTLYRAVLEGQLQFQGDVRSVDYSSYVRAQAWGI